MRLVVAIMSLTACESATPVKDQIPPSPPSKLVDAMPVQKPAPTPAQIAACQGHDRQLHGTTCCESVKIHNDRKFPGMTFLSCTGPQIGTPCAAKGDCDIACSCDDPSQLLDSRNGPLGPKDGTRGVTGVCGGRLQIGVWMCQIDEHGAVSHVIVD